MFLGLLEIRLIFFAEPSALFTWIGEYRVQDAFGWEFPKLVDKGVVCEIRFWNTGREILDEKPIFSTLSPVYVVCV